MTLVFQLRLSELRATKQTKEKKTKKQFPMMTFNERSPCLLSEKTHEFVFLFPQMGGAEAGGGAVSHRCDSFQSDYPLGVFAAPSPARLPRREAEPRAAAPAC